MVLISSMIFIPIIGSIVVALLGKVAGNRAVRGASLVIALINFLLSAYVYASIYLGSKGGSYSFVEGPYQWIPAFKGVDYLVGIDGLSGPLVLISTILTILVVLGSWDLIREHEPAFYSLILLFAGSIIGVFTSLNLILFYVFWEVVLIPMFFFVGVWGGPRRKYAAMKFFIFTFTGSLVMLLGFLLTYLFSGKNTFNITELGAIPLWVQMLAGIATFLGFAVKLPIVPFHTWLPDAHVEAPAPISVFLAGLLLKMGGYGIIRINLGLYPEASQVLAPVFIALGIITMFYGALVAMVQTDIKRLIANTSINHMGFVLLGTFTGNVFGVSGAIFQMFNHAAAIGILFMLSGYIHEQAGTREIHSLKGLKFTMPRTAVVLILGSLAAMGVPIYSSFVSEYMVIVGIISVDIRYAIVVLIPILTVGYFLWMLKRTVMSRPIPTTEIGAEAKTHDLTLFSATHLMLYLLPLIVTLIFPSLILGVADPLSKNYIAMLRR